MRGKKRNKYVGWGVNSLEKMHRAQLNNRKWERWPEEGVRASQVVAPWCFLKDIPMTMPHPKAIKSELLQVGIVFYIFENLHKWSLCPGSVENKWPREKEREMLMNLSRSRCHFQKNVEARRRPDCGQLREEWIKTTEPASGEHKAKEIGTKWKVRDWGVRGIIAGANKGFCFRFKRQGVMKAAQ